MFFIILVINPIYFRVYLPLNYTELMDFSLKAENSSKLLFICNIIEIVLSECFEGVILRINAKNFIIKIILQ